MVNSRNGLAKSTVEEGNFQCPKCGKNAVRKTEYPASIWYTHVVETSTIPGVRQTTACTIKKETS